MRDQEEWPAEDSDDLDDGTLPIIVRRQRDTEVLERYAALVLQRRELEAQAKRLKDEASVLENEIMVMFEQGGDARRFRLPNGQRVMVSLNSQIWAKMPQGRPAALAALGKLGLNQFMTIDSSQVSSYLRELVRNADVDDPKDAIPEELRGAIEPETRFTIRVTRSG